MNTIIESLGRQLFVFVQFGGDNKSFCNQQCGKWLHGDEKDMYCYGTKDKAMRSFWNGKPDLWEKTLERLDCEHGGAGIYGVLSYGESMGMDGFYDIIEIFGRHPLWSICMVTNLSYEPTNLVNTRLAQEGRLFIHPSWHPYGMQDMEKGWQIFTKNLLILQAHNVPTHVLYCWWPPQTKLFPRFFNWLDGHGFRVNVRRYVEEDKGLRLPVIHKRLGGGARLAKYSQAERNYIYANTCPKVTKYGLDLVSCKGKTCTAGKDMILIKYNGDVALCADTEGTIIGNAFNPDFHLNTQVIKCPTCVCGGDYGMLHLIDEEFGENPKRLPNDTFLSIAENMPLPEKNQPYPYHKRREMICNLALIELENTLK